MPLPRPVLSHDQIRDHVRDHVFGTAAAPVPDAQARSSVGIELEWLTGYRSATERLPLEQAEALIGDVTPLPGGSRITIEPGGQLELSGARCDRVDDALATAALDVFHLDRACAERRVELTALGADPVRRPARVVRAARYAAMEAFFDADNRAGRTMMCNTAAIQVNLGLGPASATLRRWRLANMLAPTLIACFANSPFADGGPSGWQSTRQRSWWMLDPSRAAPPETHGDPRQCWIDYALAARVMFIRAAEHDYRPVHNRLSFGRWMVEGHELGWPTLDDFAYHLTTLFPPVRPRGWFEVRVIDALPTPFWQVAVLLVHTALTDEALADDIERAVAGTEDLWIDAAQLGLGHPALHRAARAVFSVVTAALEPRSADNPLFDVFTYYADRWVRRGRTPSDDHLDAWRRTGELVPRRGSPVPYAHDLFVEADL